MVSRQNHGYRESEGQKVDSNGGRLRFQPFPFQGKCSWNKPKTNQQYNKRVYRQECHRLVQITTTEPLPSIGRVGHTPCSHGLEGAAPFASRVRIFSAEVHPFSNFDFRVSIPYPKISLTLSKMDDPRSAGLFSTLSVAPSCSMSFRCSRVSFVGVNTRTW